MRFFFYGTLLEPEVRRRVIGRAGDDLVPATLLGFRRVGRLGASYPILEEAAGARTDGLIMSGLTGSEARRLDRYEGDEYVRAERGLNTASGVRTAWIYFPIPGVASDGRDWSLDAWRAARRP